MKTSLDHLPEKRRAKITAMAAKIRAEAPAADMIILYGSHARGDWVSDPATGYESDYDLLVVVESAEVAENETLWSRVSEAIQPFAQPSYAQLIAHDMRFVDQEIRRGQFFWVEVWQQGIVLYDSRRFMLARPKAATPEERRALEQEYFDHWFTSAGQFFVSHGDNAARGWNALAAFELHQAVERYFATALLVFTRQKPLLHDLEKLGTLVSALHPLLAEPFPRATEEDDRLFKLLKRAYIESPADERQHVAVFVESPADERQHVAVFVESPDDDGAHVEVFVESPDDDGAHVTASRRDVGKNGIAPLQAEPPSPVVAALAAFAGRLPSRRSTRLRTAGRTSREIRETMRTMTRYRRRGGAPGQRRILARDSMSPVFGARVTPTAVLLSVPLALVLGGCPGTVVEGSGGAGAGGGAGAAASAGGASTGGGDAGTDLPKDCVDLFNGGVPAVCCPDPPPDCSMEPDGYPGYPCVDKHNEYCSCACSSGQWTCAC